MCSPTLVIASLGLAMSAYGTYSQGQSQKAQHEYQSAVASNNQIISDRQADDALKRGVIAEDAHRLKVARIKGAQRVGFAGRGLDLGSDLVTTTLADTAMFGELDALTIRNNAERESYGYKTQGMNYAASSQASLLAAGNAGTSGMLSAGATILSGGANIYGDYMAGKKVAK